MTTRYLFTLPVAAAVAAFAVACGSSGSSGDTAATAPPPAGSAPATSAPTTGSSGSGSTASGTTLTIKDFMFSTITVAPGAKITVTNEDSAPHTATISSANVDVSVAPGASATMTAPTKAGTYQLTCDVHPSMHGTLTVS